MFIDLRVESDPWRMGPATADNSVCGEVEQLSRSYFIQQPPLKHYFSFVQILPSVHTIYLDPLLLLFLAARGSTPPPPSVTQLSAASEMQCKRTRSRTCYAPCESQQIIRFLLLLSHYGFRRVLIWTFPD